MSSQRPARGCALVSLLLLTACALPLQAQGRHEEEEYDGPDPWTGFEERGTGPDSAGVSRMLGALAATDPVVCRLAVQSVGNSWQRDEDDGMLGEPTGDLHLQEALSRRVTDAGALARLSAALSDQKPCLRRAAARMLGNSEQNEALRLLRAALRSPDPRTREAGALGLAEAEDPAAF